MLVMGVCNPPGEGERYNGLWYKQEELEEVVRRKLVHGLPVKTEHSGVDVGRVVSGFLGPDGALRCVVEVDEASLEGAVASGFVRDGIAADFSLGYAVDVRHSEEQGGVLRACEKRLLEISLVRKGARSGCNIAVIQENSGDVLVRTPPTADDAWLAFDLSAR